MALIDCDFFAETLGLSTAMTVILPQQTTRQIGMEGKSGEGTSTTGEDASPGTETSSEDRSPFSPRYPTLYLLHGLSDDQTTWLRRTSIERYVAPLGLAVVMPAVGRSWYTDMARGRNYWTFVSEELPALARQFFPLSHRREDNFVAGLSMGGYGAFKLALRQPEKFAAAASLSGALDLARSGDESKPEWDAEMTNVFGDRDAFADSEHDAMALARRLAASDRPQPRFYQCCGTADFLYPQNVSFRDEARRLGLDLTYEEHADRRHNWGYWDMAIQRVLDWLPRHGT